MQVNSKTPPSFAWESGEEERAKLQRAYDEIWESGEETRRKASRARVVASERRKRETAAALAGARLKRERAFTAATEAIADRAMITGRWLQRMDRRVNPITTPPRRARARAVRSSHSSRRTAAPPCQDSADPPGGDSDPPHRFQFLPWEAAA